MNRPGPAARRPGGESPVAGNGRGILLLLVAFVIGVAILRSTDPGGVSSSAATTKTKSHTTTTRSRSSSTSLPVTTVPPAARPPAEVKVLPVNDSGIAGIGGKTGDQLRAAGYNALAATNSTSSSPAATSTVEFGAGAEGDALAVARLLGLQPTAVKPLAAPPVDDTRGADVVVLIGGDIAAALTAASSTTSTTGG